MALAHLGVRPSLRGLLGDPGRPGRPGPAREGPAVDFEVFKETQARRVAGPDVIAAALAAHPELLRLPRLAAAGDPEAEIRESLVAAVVPGTDLIRVSMAAESADEAAGVVNAVVDAYLEVGRRRRRGGGRGAAAGGSARPRRSGPPRSAGARGGRRAGRAGSGPVDAGRARDRDSAAVEAYRALTRQLLQADLELVEAQARLDRLRDGRRRRGRRPTRRGPDAEVVGGLLRRPPGGRGPGPA